MSIKINNKDMDKRKIVTRSIIANNKKQKIETLSSICEKREYEVDIREQNNTFELKIKCPIQSTNISEEQNVITTNLIKVLLSQSNPNVSDICSILSQGLLEASKEITKNQEQPIENYSGVIHHDKLLIGKQAREILDKYLENFALFTSFEKNTVYYFDNNKGTYCKYAPDYQNEFKNFYENCYKKGKTYRDDLLKVEEVDDNDPRTALHGQDKVIAKTYMPKNTIIGIYTGIYLNSPINEDNTDIKAELSRLAKDKNFEGMKTLNAYAFNIQLGENDLLLSAYGRGNPLIKINANTSYSQNEPNYQSNIVAEQVIYVSGVPFIFYWTKRDIAKNEELLIDYGKSYWKNLKKSSETINFPLHDKLKLIDKCVQVTEIDKPVNDGPIRLYVCPEIKGLKLGREVKTEESNNFYEFNSTLGNSPNIEVNQFTLFDNYLVAPPKILKMLFIYNVIKF